MKWSEKKNQAIWINLLINIGYGGQPCCPSYLYHQHDLIMSSKQTEKVSIFCAKLIGTGFGAGYCPLAPGTAGSLLAGGIWFLLCQFLLENKLYHLLPCLILLFTLAGVWAANKLQPIWGEDPSRIVIDEIVGTWIVLYVVPAGNPYLALLGILLFRFFDILKPLGIRLMEKVSGGWGVMLDDILAGIYGVLCMLLLQWITFCF